MVRGLLWLLAPLALAGCKPAPPVRDVDPALWVIRDGDTTLYLFGTVHALKPGLGWFDDGVKAAFDRSDELVLELVLPPPAETAALLRELGGLSAGASLPPAVARKLHEALVREGQPAASLDGVEPWLAAIQLSVIPARKLGYDSANGAETVLSEAARKAGKPVSGLETAREQFGYFDRLPAGAQLTLLGQSIDAMPRTGAMLDRIVAAWGAGDAAGLDRLMNAELAANPELAEALLNVRNRNWATALAGRMARPGTIFVAVGAGHLGGLQAELARRGFRAERVAY